MIFTKQSWIDYKKCIEKENKERTKGSDFNTIHILREPSFADYMDFVFEVDNGE